MVLLSFMFQTVVSHISIFLHFQCISICEPGLERLMFSHKCFLMNVVHESFHMHGRYAVKPV